jgi:hypothetical protein
VAPLIKKPENQANTILFGELIENGAQDSPEITFGPYFRYSRYFENSANPS